MYWIIHLTETDGDIMLWPCKDGKEIENYLTKMKLNREDYAIIEGQKLKDFNHVTFDYKRLRENTTMKVSK